MWFQGIRFSKILCSLLICLCFSRGKFIGTKQVFVPEFDYLNISKFQRSVCCYKEWQNKSLTILCFECGNWVWTLSVLTGYFHSYFLSLNSFALLACQTVLLDGGPVILERHPQLICQLLPSYVLALSVYEVIILSWYFLLCSTSTF